MNHATSLTVFIEGECVPVTRDDAGRLYARLPAPDGNGYREWHAMTFDILNQRIARSLETKPS